MKKLLQLLLLLNGFVWGYNGCVENSSDYSSEKHFLEYEERTNFSISDINKEALINCLENRYEKALDKFNRVLSFSFENNKKQFSVALWGKLICDAYLENWDAMFIDIEVLENLLNACCEDCYSEVFDKLPSKSPLFFANLNSHSSEFYNSKRLLVNDTGFAFPDEILTPDQCYARVRLFTVKIQDMISTKFNKKENTPDNCYALDKLWTFLYKISRRGEDCCYKGTHWTICCGPINQIWRTWKNEGVPDSISEYK